MSSGTQKVGVGFCEALLIVFITLKLTDNIDWSWWWVLAPFWIPASLVLSIALFIVVLGRMGMFKYKGSFRRS